MARKRAGANPNDSEPEDHDETDELNAADDASDDGLTEQPLPVRMTNEQIEEVTALLRTGQRLPPHLFPNLFEVPREYELAYRSKARVADVLADTMAMPIQAVRTFGEPTNGWSNMLIFGDNLQVLRHLVNVKIAGGLANADGSPGVRLCYIDPPFASEQEFTGSREQRAYSDRVAGAEFVEHLRRRLILIRELLSDDGMLLVHLDQRKVHYIKVVLDEVFGESNFRNEVIVKRPISKNLQAQFESVSRVPVGHDTLLLYSVTPSARFPVPRRLIADPKHPEGYWHRFWSGADRPTMRYELLGVKITKGQWKWEEQRALRAVANYRRYSREAKGRSLHEYWRDTGETLEFIRKNEKSGEPENWFPPSESQIADTLWLQLKAYPNLKQYPTQKDSELLSYIVKSFSRPGDLVLDAFAGSGTTLLAAQGASPSRRWIGIDSGKFAIYVTQTRLLREKAPRPGFTLFNGGLYDYAALRALSWPRYLSFVLQLFQCRRADFELSGVPFHGYVADDPVFVYDFRKHNEARIGREFIEDLARLCGNRLGDRCFVIAPASVVELYEDYITIGRTRFFFLRIPYSVIAELHKRAFSDLRQPTSESRANAPIDSVGFDFVVPPRVECRYSSTKDSLGVEITQFESEAFAATESEEDIANLAMVLVDYDYDGDLFKLDAVHFAENLDAADWKFSIPAKDAGDQVLIVYIDVFGNEYRELKTRDDFAGRRSNGRRGARARGRRRAAGPTIDRKRAKAR